MKAVFNFTNNENKIISAVLTQRFRSTVRDHVIQFILKITCQCAEQI